MVGAPIFAIHWWLIARGWNGTDEAAADDRRSAIRAFHMALVATVSMAVGLYAAQRLLEPLFGAILGVVPAEAPWADGAVPGNVALLLVAAPVWWFHMDCRNADLRHDRLGGASAWLTRLDRYGWAFIGLMTLLIGAGQLIQTVASALIGQPDMGRSGDWSGGFIASSLAAIVAGGVVWWLHADDARRAIRDAAIIGEDDRSTALRATYFGAVLLVALATGGLTIAGSITELGRVLLGVADQTGVRPFLEAVLGPLLVAVPFVMAGWLHWQVMRGEAARAGTAALATAERLRLHLTALLHSRCIRGGKERSPTPRTGAGGIPCASGGRGPTRWPCAHPLQPSRRKRKGEREARRRPVAFFGDIASDRRHTGSRSNDMIGSARWSRS